mgnify:FL=1
MAVVKMVTTLPGDWKEFEVGEWAHVHIENLLAACIQIERIRSMYRWDGMVNSEEEWRLTLTTTHEKASILAKSIEKSSPYDVPQIIWNTVDASEAYSSWTEGAIK